MPSKNTVFLFPLTSQEQKSLSEKLKSDNVSEISQRNTASGELPSFYPIPKAIQAVDSPLKNIQENDSIHSQTISVRTDTNALVKQNRKKPIIIAGIAAAAVAIIIAIITGIASCGNNPSDHTDIISGSETNIDNSLSENKSEYEDPEADPGTIVDSGNCGDNITYTLYDKGLLIISGSGKMENYTGANETPWHEKCDSIKAVIIKNDVTSIGDCAFYYCTNLASITIPDIVTSIGKYAFSDCTNLEDITIPDSVTSIGSSAFYHCRSLKNITIPNSVTTIKEKTFKGCDSLTSITLPDSLTSIEELAFYECTSLSSLTIPNGVSKIGDYAFRDNSSLTSLTISQSVTSIGVEAFNGCCSLTNITVDKNNKCYASLDGVLFDKDITILICCPGAKSGQYDIPDSVKSISIFAFEDCRSLTSITIPYSVTKIDYDAFFYLTPFQTIIIKGRNEAPSGWNSLWNNKCDAKVSWNS